MLPPCLVIRQGAHAGLRRCTCRTATRSRCGSSSRTAARRHDVRQLENWEPPREVDGRLVGEATFAGAGRPAARLPHAARAVRATPRPPPALVVTPAWLGLPERLGDRRGLGAGHPALQRPVPAVLGRRRPGRPGRAGRLGGAELGAGFVLVNPLHAAEPTAPMEPSPYLPTTRRFANPLYLRVEQVAGVRRPGAGRTGPRSSALRADAAGAG